jgi:putative DNA primase/helicase
MSNPGYVQPDDESDTFLTPDNQQGAPGHSDEQLTDSTGRELVERYGFPAFKNEKGKLSKLNEPFWAAYHADREPEMLFEPNEEEIYRYDDQSGLYQSHSTDLIRKKLAEQILEKSRTWPALAELERFRNESALKGILAHLRGELERPEAFRFDGKIIHLANCVLEFAPDGSFTPQPFSPKYRSRNRSPIAYDPKADCPAFKEKILGHVEPDNQELLQQYGGQCLLGRNLTQRILILDGVGGASKSAFVLVTRGIIGPANTYELRTEHLCDRFEIGRMIGKTLLLGSDVKAGFLSTGGASRLKSLVGGDTLEAERKGSNKQFSISGNFNALITSNSRLRVQLEGDQSAWRRRLAIARYENTFTANKIPNIHELLLKTEGSGILNWYLEGAQKLFKSIAETGDICQSARQRERADALLSESDSLRIFLRENLAGVRGRDLTADEIITEYNRYAIDAGWNPTPRTLAQRQLEDLMLELFSVVKVNDIKRDGKNQRGFRNVRIRQDDEQDPLEN